MTLPNVPTNQQRVTRALIFIGQRCILHPALVVPLRALWREYETWCKQAPDRPDPLVYDLRSALDEAPWARVTEPRGKGLIRVVVHGVGIRNDGSS